jgi:hypothetical protein
MSLTWTTSVSADAENHDQEVDLAPLGHPKGACWASVGPDGDGWVWSVYDRWLYEDATTLAAGVETTEEAAKAAVEEWLA